MASKISKILGACQDPHTEEIALDQFKKSFNKRSKELSKRLKAESGTTTDLLKDIDSLVGSLLHFRWNIVEHARYEDDWDDQGRCHKEIKETV